jgi:hypothetical protein
VAVVVALRVELRAQAARAAAEMVLLPKAAMLQQTRAAVVVAAAMATAAAMEALALLSYLSQQPFTPAPQPDRPP